MEHLRFQTWTSRLEHPDLNNLKCLMRLTCPSARQVWMETPTTHGCHGMTHGMPEARIGARHSRRGRADCGAFPSGKKRHFLLRNDGWRCAEKWWDWDQCMSIMNGFIWSSIYVYRHIPIYIYICVCVRARVCLQMCNKGNSGWIHLESFALSLCNPHTSPGQRPTSPSHSHHRQPRRALGAPDSEGFSPLRRG